MGKNNCSLSWHFSNLVWTVLKYTMPTKKYLEMKYKTIFGRKINWDNPKYFTEKLQWLKVYGCKPEYVKMVDKVLVKEYIKEQLGEEYVIPTLGVWDSANDITIKDLPQKFVMKCNHDSGTCIVCSDKTTFDLASVREVLGNGLKNNYYLMGRETPYKSVKRKIFAEAFLEHDDDLVDYKFFCFNGEPRVLKIDYDRSTKHHANYYDIDMNLLPFFKKSSKPDVPKVFEKPEHYDKMVEIAKQLSNGIPFVRVDLYNLNGKIYFGEITFFPSSGFEPLTDDAWDEKMGSWIDLNN